MANINDAFRVEGISLDDIVGIFRGSNDPSSGIGEIAPIGSLFIRDAGELYQKTTAPDTGWTLFGSGGGGGTLATLSDVTLASLTDNEVLAYDSGTSTWINQTPTEAGLASSVALSNLQIEVDAIESSTGGILTTSGTFDPNAFSVIGSYGDFVNINTPVDLLDSLKQLDQAMVNIATDLSAVSVGVVASFALPLAFTDVVWDVDHLQNDITTIEHSTVNPERILIKETGLYFVNFSISFDADPGEEVITVQLMQNGTTVVPGSLRIASEDDEINDLSNATVAEFSAGDYITLQSMASGTGNLFHNSSNLTIIRAKGSKGADGATGPTGVGTSVNIENEGTLLTGGPFDTINFIGGTITAVDAGANTANVTITPSVYGTEYSYTESLGTTTITTTAYQEKLKLTTGIIPAGTYRIGWSYSFNHNNSTNDFRGRVQVDDSNIISLVQLEPKDSAGNFGTTGSNQKAPASGFANVVFTAGVHTVDIDISTTSAGVNSSIWDARIELYRVL